MAAPASGLLSDRLGPIRIMRGSLPSLGARHAGLSPGAGALPLVIALTLTMSVLGGVVPSGEPHDLRRPRSGPSRARRAFALNRLAINLGMSVGPAVGGFLATVSFAWLFFVNGATSIAGGTDSRRLDVPAASPRRQRTPADRSGRLAADAPAARLPRREAAVLPRRSSSRRDRSLPAHGQHVGLPGQDAEALRGVLRRALHAELPDDRFPRSPHQHRDRPLAAPADARARRAALRDRVRSAGFRVGLLVGRGRRSSSGPSARCSSSRRWRPT